MGGAKNKNLNDATSRSTGAQATEDKRAQEMQDNVSNTRTTLQGRANKSSKQASGAINNNIQTGGFDPTQTNNINSQFKNAGAIGTHLANTGPVTQQQITDAANGRGRETYDEFAKTGGFSQNDKDAYLRSSGRAATAGFAANRDELNRRAAIQGGYMPGYTSGMANLDRAAGQKAAEARTDANSSLAQLVAKNRLAGAGGLADTREAAGKEALLSQQQQNDAMYKGGSLVNQGALGQSDLTQSQAKNKVVAGQQMLDYYKANLQSMTDADRTQIENRLAQLGYTRADIDAHLGAASQRQNALSQVKSGVDIAGSAASAIGGL